MGGAHAEPDPTRAVPPPGAQRAGIAVRRGRVGYHRHPGSRPGADGRRLPAAGPVGGPRAVGPAQGPHRSGQPGADRAADRAAVGCGTVPRGPRLTRGLHVAGRHPVRRPHPRAVPGAGGRLRGGQLDRCPGGRRAAGRTDARGLDHRHDARPVGRPVRDRRHGGSDAAAPACLPRPLAGGRGRLRQGPGGTRRGAAASAASSSNDCSTPWPRPTRPTRPRVGSWPT